jgi:hypothetical protein
MFLVCLPSPKPATQEHLTTFILALACLSSPKSATQEHLTTCILAEFTPYLTYYNFTQTTKATLLNPTYDTME